MIYFLLALLSLLLTAGCQSSPASPAVASTPIPTASDTPLPTTKPTSTRQPINVTSPSATPEQTRQWSPPPDDLPHVTLDVDLSYNERWMRVSQQVELRNTSADDWDEIVFHVPLNYRAGTFILDEVTIQQSESAQSSSPTFPDGQTTLRIMLPDPAAPRDALTIELRYRVIIPPVASTDWPPVGTTGWTFNLIQAGEWYPSLVPYRDGEGWDTWQYVSIGDPTIYPLVDTELVVRTQESGITVVSGGAQNNGEDGVWRFAVEGARGIAFLASDRYQIARQQVGEVTVSSAYLPEHEAAGQAALEMAVVALTLFEDLYGPYPYEDLIIAENGFFGGMEYSALISITDYAYLIYSGEAPSLLGALVAHEVAHQWWYGAVGNDQVREPWLDESLAFYSELLYFQSLDPAYSEWWWQKRVLQYAPSGPVNAAIYDYTSSERFILSMYGRAALFIDSLRETMGDEAFFAFLRDYYARYRWEIVTEQDFFQTAAAHTDADLAPLREEYFSEED